MNEIEYKIHVDKIYEKIEFARKLFDSHHIVRIVAISKSVQADAIESLYNIGQRAYGENRVQDLIDKQKKLDDLPLEWHFVGRLQSNKINSLIDANPHLFHSLSSFDLAQALDKRLAAKSKKMDCLLQINSANEESKAGVSYDEAIDVYQRIESECQNIKLKGVMSIGAHTADKESIESSFRKTRAVFDSIDSATICSMGMSSDYELAIECGSNMLRLGSTLFPQH